MKKTHIVWLVISIAPLFLGTRFALIARKHFRLFAEWQKAKPVSMKVDLSKPGEYVGQFNQTCIHAHGCYLVLEVPQDFYADEDKAQALESLVARYSITDADGTEKVTHPKAAEIKPWTNTRKLRDGSTRRVTYLSSVEASLAAGQYEFELTVNRGVGELTGVEQQLTCLYALCGLEAFPALVGAGCAIASYLVAGIIIICVSVLHRKQKKCQQRAAIDAAARRD